MKMTPTVKQLLIVNILFFIGSQMVPQAYDFLALYYPANDQFQWWQPVTSMFMHAPLPNVMHIVFNMFALFMFGSPLEHYWGWKKFLFFYVSCGLGAVALQLGITYLEIRSFLDGAAGLGLSPDEVHKVFNLSFVQDGMFRGDLFLKGLESVLTDAQLAGIDQEEFHALFKAAATSQSTMVGASGAIYGLLVAFAFMFPNVQLFLMFIPIPIKAKYFVPGLLVFDLIGGVSSSAVVGGPSSGVAHFAHIGGALFGFLMMWYWKKNQFNANRWN